jgi:L-asparaginase/Glu-tRNA(Gln) amidotransferase subunit D
LQEIKNTWPNEETVKYLCCQSYRTNIIILYHSMRKKQKWVILFYTGGTVGSKSLKTENTPSSSGRILTKKGQ